MLHNETPLTLSEAAAALPKIGGKKISTSTLWRWAVKGCRGVRLEVRRLGGRHLTSLEALDRFGKALAEATPPPVSDHRRMPRRRTATQVQQAAARAERNLAQRGT